MSTWAEGDDFHDFGFAKITTEIAQKLKIKGAPGMISLRTHLNVDPIKFMLLRTDSIFYHYFGGKLAHCFQNS